MKNAAISIAMEQEKLRALQFYMGKKDASLDAELSDNAQRMYEKTVPGAVREYIEATAGEDMVQAKARTVMKEDEKNGG